MAADEPIVAAELRMRAVELLDAFAAAPGGARVRFLRLAGEPGRDSRGRATAARIIVLPLSRGERHAPPPTRVAQPMRPASCPPVSS